MGPSAAIAVARLTSRLIWLVKGKESDKSG